MDVFAHALWTNAMARGGNKIAEKSSEQKEDKKKFHLHIGWTAFFGVFPDLFAFTFPFIFGIYKIITGLVPTNSFGRPNDIVGGFDLAQYLYQFSHSLVVWAFVFLVVWFFSKRLRYELLGWALHILIDIPSHVLAFYPTPFLFPISDYRFPYGVQWSNVWYMMINYSLLAVLWIGIFVKKHRMSKGTFDTK